MNCNNYNSVKIHFSPEGYSLVSVSNIEKDYFFLLDTGSTKSLLFYTHNKYKKMRRGIALVIIQKYNSHWGNISLIIHL